MDNEMSFEEMLNESMEAPKSFQMGDKLKVRVCGIDKENVYVDLGPRLQGTINKDEFIVDGELTVAMDEGLEVFVVGKERGFFKCTTRLGSGDYSKTQEPDDSFNVALNEALENGVPVEGKVVKVIKGGFEVTVMNKKAFCPLSQIDINYYDDAEVYVNKTFPFLILEIKESGKDIVLSRKKLLKIEQEKRADQLWETLNEGDVHDGKVTSIKPYGAFVNIGDVEGLLHVSEISHQRIDDPSKLLKVDDSVTVEIIKIDKENRKIGLSMKSQIEDPVIAILNKLEVDDEMEGTVVRLKPFGAFVNLFNGVDGLVHISKLGADRRIDHPKEILSVGDKVNVRILELDRESGKISLTMEKEKENYKSALEKHQKEEEQSKKKSGTMADLFDGF